MTSCSSSGLLWALLPTIILLTTCHFVPRPLGHHLHTNLSINLQGRTNISLFTSWDFLDCRTPFPPLDHFLYLPFCLKWNTSSFQFLSSVSTLTYHVHTTLLVHALEVCFCPTTYTKLILTCTWPTTVLVVGPTVHTVFFTYSVLSVYTPALCAVKQNEQERKTIFWRRPLRFTQILN